MLYPIELRALVVGNNACIRQEAFFRIQGRSGDATHEVKWDGLWSMLYSDSGGVFPSLCEGLARDLKGRRCVLDREMGSLKKWRSDVPTWVAVDTPSICQVAVESNHSAVRINPGNPDFVELSLEETQMIAYRLARLEEGSVLRYDE